MNNAEDLDHAVILAAVQELPFSVGKGTLSELLVGAVSKKMVSNDTYMELDSYSALSAYPQIRIEQTIDRLVASGHLALVHPRGQSHMRVIEITAKGIGELKAPKIGKTTYASSFGISEPDELSKQLMQQFQFFLKSYNVQQQHAIVSPAKKILCVAGAGTGKTTVLTKRIEFLVAYRGVKPSSILAITFTRKARAEMQARLSSVGAEVTTFNGFCEKLLRSHGYAKPLVNYGQRVRLFQDALSAERINLHELVFDYFTDAQRKGATKEELERRLMGDVYSIIDHYSNEDEALPSKGKSTLASTLLGLARRIEREITVRGLRDYSGQTRDILALLRNKSISVPAYTHVLVDEYQDVNVAQQRLIDLLKPENLFVVGDPRQSIFGWRGSQLRYITEFVADSTIQLQTNYRSRPVIATLMNKLIAGMNLPELVAAQTAGGAVQTLKYTGEEEELGAVAAILKHATNTDIFVLARTNRQLQDLSVLLTRGGVAHSIKKEEDEGAPSGLVLATVHAIKGLEARTVIVIGATSRYFPCKVSEHPVVDLIKDAYLDREEEERRLLYVAVSRAKETLIVTYTTTPSYFFDGVLPPITVSK